jgi:hypothetical protein
MSQMNSIDVVRTSGVGAGTGSSVAELLDAIWRLRDQFERQNLNATVARLRRDLMSRQTWIDNAKRRRDGIVSDIGSLQTVLSSINSN